MQARYFPTKLSPHFRHTHDLCQTAYNSSYLASLCLPKTTNQRSHKAAKETKNKPAIADHIQLRILNSITALYAAHAEKTIPRKDSSMPTVGFSGGEQRRASGVCEKFSVVYFGPPQL